MYISFLDFFVLRTRLNQKQERRYRLTLRDARNYLPRILFLTIDNQASPSCTEEIVHLAHRCFWEIHIRHNLQENAFVHIVKGTLNVNGKNRCHSVPSLKFLFYLNYFICHVTLCSWKMNRFSIEVDISDTYFEWLFIFLLF
jgi:hypothetical protein